MGSMHRRNGGLYFNNYMNICKMDIYDHNVHRVQIYAFSGGIRPAIKFIEERYTSGYKV